MNPALPAVLLGALGGIGAAGAQEPASVAPTPSAVIRADRVVLDDGWVRGAGNVACTWEDLAFQVASFAWNPESGAVDLEAGTVPVGNGHLHFRGAGTAASGLPWRLEGVEATLCGCTGGRVPWTLAAREVRVVPGRDHVWIRGPVLRLWDVPVLWLPVADLPLRDRQSGLLAPSLGWSQDGPEVSLPLYLVLGPSADLTLTPAWREARGARLSIEARHAVAPGGRTVLTGTGGWDREEQAFRGLVDAQHGWAPGRLRTAVDATVVSDAAWIDDYGVAWLDRQVPFQEARALVGLGPVTLDHGSFQDTLGASQRLLGVALDLPATRVGPIATWEEAAVALVGDGVDVASLRDREIRSEAGFGLVAGLPIGPVEVEASGSLRGTSVSSLDAVVDPTSTSATPGGEGRAEASVRVGLPFWADGPRIRRLHRLSLGVTLTGREVVGTWDPEDVPWLLAGPRFETRWVTSGGVPLHLVADLPVSPDGLLPEVAAWWQQGPGWLRLGTRGSLPMTGDESLFSAADVPIAEAQGGWDGDALDLTGRLTHAVGGGVDPVDQGSARLRWTLPSARRGAGMALIPGYGLRVDLATGAVLEQVGEVGLSSRCDCLDLRVSAAFAADRAWPDLALRVDVTPRR